MLLRAATSKRLSDEMLTQAREDLSRLPRGCNSLPAPDARSPDHAAPGLAAVERAPPRADGRLGSVVRDPGSAALSRRVLAGLSARSGGASATTGSSPSTGKPSPVVDQLFWAGYPCGYYLPSTVAPIGLVDGLPVGIQIVGRRYDDLTCLHMAGLIEEGYYRFTPPPGY